MVTYPRAALPYAGDAQGSASCSEKVTPPGDLQRDGEVLDRTNLPEMTPGSSLT